MTESMVRSVLRIIAAVTMFVGVTMTTSALFTLLAAQQAMRGGLAQDVVFATLLSPLVITLEGYFFYLLSAPLARRIVAPPRTNVHPRARSGTPMS